MDRKLWRRNQLKNKHEDCLVPAIHSVVAGLALITAIVFGYYFIKLVYLLITNIIV